MPPVLKLIKGFPGYRVGSDGSIWSHWKTRRRATGGRGVESYLSNQLKRMKPCPHTTGYQLIHLRKEGAYYHFLIHRLVLETFVGLCPEGNGVPTRRQQ
jgi:hypothetical protein